MMTQPNCFRFPERASRAFLVFFFIFWLGGNSAMAAGGAAENANLAPLLSPGKPVDWWFVFKFNTQSFPKCAGNAQRTCLFGGDVQSYRGGFGQQYVYASSENPVLQEGGGCVGDTLSDPVGATFNQIYNGSSHYVVWNDQFYDAPKIQGCTGDCGSPWGHPKGILAWNDGGEGLVIQVSTPSWPA